MRRDVPSWIDPEDAWAYRVGPAQFVEQARSFERVYQADPERRFHWKHEAHKMWANAVVALLERIAMKCALCEALISDSNVVSEKARGGASRRVVCTSCGL